MRRTLLATTIFALTAGAVMATTIIPGQGSLTDAGGNVWTITSNGSIQEGTQWVAGGGGTAALAITADGTVYGQDAKSQSWLTLSGKLWSPASAPPAMLTAGPNTTPPMPAPPITRTPTGGCLPTTPSGSFGILNGVIYDQNQQPFIARGINVMHFGGDPSAAEILAQFPATNFVRLATYNYDTPASLTAQIADYTSHGIVVEIEHHVGAGGGVPPLIGGDLAQENAWFTSLATAFKSNPDVWFGTLNEPRDTGSSAGDLAAEMASNYQAIRGTGSNAPIMLSLGSGPPPVDTSKMTNIILDQHFYGWTSNFSTIQSVVTANLNSIIANDTTMSAGGPVPVIIGEYGNSTDPSKGIDANGNQVIQAVAQSGLGSAAWAWGSGGPGDGLTNGDGYGTKVAANIMAAATAAPAVSVAAACSGGTTVVAAADPLTPSSDQAPPTDAQIQMRSDMIQAQSDATQMAQTAQTQAVDTQAQVAAVMDKKATVQDQIQQLLKRKAAQ